MGQLSLGNDAASSARQTAGASGAAGAAGAAGGFSFDRIVGRSVALRSATDLARRFARSRGSTVLLVGETGTGKELFARGLHYEGPNASAPFVAVNCAAIPESLLESELFGHEAGAFTGAKVRKHGLMELAGCGTLFLDEIHQLPSHLQPKLLRALEDRRIRRVGGTQEIAIDCRIVAATNVEVDQAVDSGQLRDDLFYRLNVLRIDLPALRDRAGDIELLAQHFLAEMLRNDGIPKRLAPDAVAALQAHAWPGNVRELKNVIERAAVMSGDELEIREADLLVQRRVSRRATPRDNATVGEIEIPLVGKSLREIEREAVRLTLELTRGNQSQAARVLGISRPTLAKIMREGALRPESFEAAS